MVLSLSNCYRLTRISSILLIPRSFRLNKSTDFRLIGLTMQSSRGISSGLKAATQPLYFLDGRRIHPMNEDASDDIVVSQPATGKKIAVMRGAGRDDVDRAVHSANQAFQSFGLQTSGTQRGRILQKASQLIREYKEEIAQTEVLDNGKPIWEARFDTEGCADCLEYFAGQAAGISGEHITLPEGSFAYTRREPLGVVGAIGAWNYPFQMACWKSAPAIACGNSFVFKPSSFTPLTAVLLGEIYKEAGLPDGIYNVIQGGGKTGELLSNHPDVAKMSFTGSVGTGTKVMKACAEGIKHVTLELGGKSPLIVFEDANIDNAVSGALMANFLTQGEVCSNGTRVYVHEKVWDEFVKKFVFRTERMKIGDPTHEDTKVGAMISPEQAQTVLSFIDEAQKQGARVLCGGQRVTLDDPALAGGWYLSPCILSDVADDARIAREEVFGAVACLFKFSTEEEVLRRANDSELGLAGGIFTNDLTRAHRVAARLQAGSLYINNYNIYPVEVPFGGFKKSGIGRENGKVALDFYSQLKSVYVEAGNVWCPF